MKRSFAFVVFFIYITTFVYKNVDRFYVIITACNKERAFVKKRRRRKINYIFVDEIPSLLIKLKSEPFERRRLTEQLELLFSHALWSGVSLFLS